MRLLVVEDYEPLRESLVEGLSEAGYAVDATGDGREGLWYVGDGAYDVVVLDLMLPGVDGLSILRRMREEGKQGAVLILTSKGEVGDRVLGLDEGADDYLVKPFAFEELLARVNALVRRRYSVGSSRIEVGGLWVDLKGREAGWGEEKVELTAREFGILEVLALNRGRVVTRTEISEHLYGFDCEPESNAIDVHVGQLRRKLGGVGGEVAVGLVRTRRGMGYVLEEAEPCGH